LSNVGNNDFRLAGLRRSATVLVPLVGKSINDDALSELSADVSKGSLLEPSNGGLGSLGGLDKIAFFQGSAD